MLFILKNVCLPPSTFSLRSWSYLVRLVDRKRFALGLQFLVEAKDDLRRNLYTNYIRKRQFGAGLSREEEESQGTCIFHVVKYTFEILSMGKKTAGGYYAVARGRTPGIYRTWDACKAQVDHFQNARYKKFTTSDEAQTFVTTHSGTGTTSGVASIPIPVPTPTVSTSVPKAEKSAVKLGGSTTFTHNSSGSVFFEGSRGKVKTKPNVLKRDFSSLKVTEDRVMNKRAKHDPNPPNSAANLNSFSVDEDGYVVVFTDGACTKNGRKAAKAGIGVWFGHNHPLNISEPVVGRQTNNTAEILAAEQAIVQAKKNGINKLKIKTDSQFTINCVTKWMHSWMRNNWRLSSGGDVKNKEDLIKLDSAMKNMEIKWSYVAGHAGIEGNEAADRLAVQGAERSTT